MIYFDGLINRYRSDRGMPIVDKEKLLEEYKSKFLVYLYQEATMIEEIEKIEKDNGKSKDSTPSEIETIGKKIIEKYGELGFCKRMMYSIQSGGLPYTPMLGLIHRCQQNIYNDLMERMIK